MLLITTTNLDQSRSVIWNIGAVAESKHPLARELIIDILLASASLPGVFPPVMLDVSIDGKHYQEMHVDGGVVTQTFVYPPSIKLSELDGAKLGAPSVYVIRNSRLNGPEGRVERNALEVTAKAISAMTAASGVNDLYRIYLTAQRDRVAFNLAYIDRDFRTPYAGPFDTRYMRALFAYGYEKGQGRLPVAYDAAWLQRMRICQSHERQANGSSLGLDTASPLTFIEAVPKQRLCDRGWRHLPGYTAGFIECSLLPVFQFAAGSIATRKDTHAGRKRDCSWVPVRARHSRKMASTMRERTHRLRIIVSKPTASATW